MKIFIGNDQPGVDVKNQLIKYIEEFNITVVNWNELKESCDYPQNVYTLCDNLLLKSFNNENIGI